jgi:hypothetical protein
MKLNLEAGSRRGRGWAHAMLAVALLAPCACKSSSATPDAGPSSGDPSASPPPEDPKTRKRITAKDCQTWAEHGSSVVVSSIVGAAAGCPPDARDAIRKKFEQDIVSIRSGANSLCTNHMDEQYSAGEAACFMSATDAIALRDCKFAPMTNPQDSDWGAIINTMKMKCAITAPPGAAPPPSGGTEM